MSCAKRKAQCDNKQPACSRCRTKAIQCRYPDNGSKGTTSKTPGTPRGDNDRPIEGQGVASSFVVDSSNADDGIEVGSQGDTPLGNELATLVSDPTHIEAVSLEWDGTSFDVSDFLNMPENHDTAQQPSFVSPTLLRASTYSAEKTYQDQQLLAYPKLSIPAQLNYNVRLFIERPKMQAGTTHRTARLILHTLKSYALMMLRHENALPPFIHPRLISQDVGDETGNDMEPLNNCISLVHMLASRLPGSRKLFWKNVLMECERLYEVVRFDISGWCSVRGGIEIVLTCIAASPLKQVGASRCHASPLHLHHHQAG